MARKQNDPVQAVAVEGAIVPDGDYAGLRVDDVMRALTDQVHDALGHVSIEVAGASLDMALGEYLAVVQSEIGEKEAKIYGIRFCETALPYATLPVKIAQSYGVLRKTKG